MDAKSPPAAAPVPEDVQRIQRQLEENALEAEVLVDLLDDERLNWQPPTGGWSIAQCLDHLSTANRVYLAAMRLAVAPARQRGAVRRGPIRPRGFARWFIDNMEPPPRHRMRSPRKIVPAARKTKAEVVGELRQAQSEVAELLRAVADLDLNAIRFVNPFIPLLRFSLGSGFQVIAAHERRHLWQAGIVRQHPAFGMP